MSRSVLRALAFALLTAATALLPALPASAAAVASGPPARATARPAGPVVLLGTAGLRWEDVGDTTPALYAMLQQGATADLIVRSVRDTTCPVDGWLAVSAGRRAGDAPPSPGAACRPAHVVVSTAGGRGRVTGWETYRAQAATGSFDADPGLLSATLTAAGRRVAAVGPGAAIGTADRSGTTAHTWPGIPPGPQGTLDPGGDALGLSRQVAAAVGTGADLVVVDLGSIRDVPVPADATTGNGPASRQDQVAALDTRLGLITGTLPDDATVILASLADDGTRSHAQLIAARGPGFDAGVLRSASTRQDGLVQSTDVLPTVLARLGVATPDGAVGSPLTKVTGGDPITRLQQATELDQASILMDRLVTPFFVGYGAVALIVLAGLGALARAARLKPKTRHRALVVLRAAAVTAAVAPAGTFAANLWPWWRGPLPGAQLGLAVALATVPPALVALAGPWRRRPLAQAGVTGALVAVILALDLATGSRLALVALIGGQPLLAGRFYGLSNPTFAIFATGALFAAVGLAAELRRRGASPGRQALAVAGVGLLATAVDGAPQLGSDFGGPPAIIPAFGLLALWVAGVRVTWRRLGILAVVTVGVLALISVADWLRPAADRTHLGRFVQTVLDGGGGAVVQRKLEQNLGMFVTTPLTLLVPPAVALAVLVLWRPARWYAPALQLAYDAEPPLRRGVAALGVLLLLGFALNDSGASIPPAALLVFVPLLVAICAHTLDRDETDRREAAAAAALRPVRRR